MDQSVGSDDSDDSEAASADASDEATPTGGVDEGADASTGGPAASCPAPDEPAVPPLCGASARPGGFDPVIEWSWAGHDGFSQVLVTPLVANMTDDNEDGAIDLCDRPDVIVVAHPSHGDWWDGRVFVLDGGTGELLVQFETPVWALTTPAVGDIDGDGLPELVTNDGLGPYPIAFEHDGAVKWNRDDVFASGREAVALADLGSDGDVDVLIGREIMQGETGWGTRIPRLVDFDATPTAADLDGDGLLEIVIGWAAFHVQDAVGIGTYDVTVMFENAEVGLTICPSGFVPDPSTMASLALGLTFGGCPAGDCINASGHPHVADLDEDSEPEIVLTDEDGISILEHDGTTKYAHLRPTGDLGVADGTACDYTNWWRPGTVQRFGGASGFAMVSANHAAAYDATLSAQWTAQVVDPGGMAATTAFDFDGDGAAEVVVGDTEALRVLDETGAELFAVPRTSATLIDLPVVADVDGDGSAEIVVVSSGGPGEESGTPAVQVVGDAQGRWVPARRIWNQHTYHVTNVREDGTIPQHEPPHWHGVNTFRANAQTEGGVACVPAGGGR